MNEAIFFPPGTTASISNQMCATLSPLNDAEVEPEETINLTATSLNPALQFTPDGDQAVINICDNGKNVGQIIILLVLISCFVS